ncbi:Antiviral helicase ski2 [Entomophthora muscae]|uniref:Antiviral helicase ski2 n=1 Tax=Entomophthora muscae TaxID=34485 RepID=A0ACC2U5L1_9FUNG|nr:Antiviral helicase ski2 [Entomophthora muscae]
MDLPELVTITTDPLTPHKLEPPLPPSFDPIAALEKLQEDFLLPKCQIPRKILPEFQTVDFDLGVADIHTYLDDPLVISPRQASALLPSASSSIVSAGLPCRLDMKLQRSPAGDSIVGYREVILDAEKDGRTIGRNFVRGSISQAPFLPGGFDPLSVSSGADISETLAGLDGLSQTEKLHSRLPGFDRGLLLETQEPTSQTLNTAPPVDVANILSGFEDLEIEEDLVEEEAAVPAEEIDEILPSKNETVAPHPTAAPTEHSEHKVWAHDVKLEKLPLDYSQVVQILAHDFPFELDLFQKHAVYHLESGDSVFIAAHTSAGKTVVAEYAIALATKHMTRAIYTSPIKALSNQKFRDFKDTFEDVGILTGDVQINPEAACLIMTTEILRSMLYRGADVIRDVEFVIFDEVHYLNDADRGVVWEEVIIMLPPHISLVLLSATVPNTMEFAEWIGRTKRKNIFVISTPRRPIPLEHHLYVDKELFKIVDERGTFLDMGWKAAKNAIAKEEQAVTPQPQRGRGQPQPRSQPSYGNASYRSGEKQEQTLWTHMVGFLKKKKLLPVIVFTFSKKRCDTNAGNLPNQDLNTATEKSEVRVFANRALSRLPAADRELPQVQRVMDLLRRGIAVHHSGLLPIVKEMVEMLFSRGLVKVLFATETFAMGVNMPARSVVFNGIRKHDGTEMRYLLPGEYTQMSGRAGRRGLDKVGMVMIVDSEQVPEMATLRHMILGKATRLASQFRLTYNMILNLLRVEALRVEDMIKRSFAEDASQQQAPQQEIQRNLLQAELDRMPALDCALCTKTLDKFITASTSAHWASSELATELERCAGRDLLAAGRVVVVDTAKYRNCLAAVVRPAIRGQLLTNTRSSASGRTYLCIILCDENPQTSPRPYNMLTVPAQPKWALCEVEVNEMTYITPDVITIERARVMQGGDMVRSQIAETLLNLAQTWGTDIPYIEQRPKNLAIEFYSTLERRGEALHRLKNLKCAKCSDLAQHFALAATRRRIGTEMLSLSEAIAGVNLDLLPEYHQRLDVLNQMAFAQDMTITLKGRVACEINSVNELVLTELILDNFFGRFDAEESVALLSCFLFKEKTRFSKGTLVGEDSRLTPQLVEGCDSIMAMCSHIAVAQNMCGLHAMSPEMYCETEVNFGLVGPVYEWARGMSFKSITQITDVAEGSVVRCITRLDDTCRDVRNAARLIGDTELYTKMEDARNKVQRDIVFAASLYI